ncbi:MAG: glycosyltransferase family 4 protein [Bacillota bacterium]
MIIALVHGYLLRGTGSNLYVSNLCRAFCRQGHRVLLFSQEYKPEEIDFISRGETFYEDNLRTAVEFKRSTAYPGECLHYRPHLGGLLPVYVYDRYPGFEVKEFPDLSERELENYLERNRLALETVLRNETPDLVISQHTIMQPVYTARALAGLYKKDGRHLVTVHGSALNFSVRKSNFLRGRAVEGINNADGLVFVSSHSRADFTAYFAGLPGLEEKCRVIFAGVNTGLFQPLKHPDEKGEQITELNSRLRKVAAEKNSGRSAQEKEEFYNSLQDSSTAEEIRELIAGFRNRSDDWAPDQDASGELKEINWAEEKIVLYYGKYLWTKGIHLLLGAMPLVLQKYPQTRLILVGFGAAREYLEAITGVLDQGRVELALEMIANPGSFGFEGVSKNNYSEDLFKLLSDPREASKYRDACEGKISQQVIFTGIMDHEELRMLIPCADVAVAPSIFPEAFGLVGVEALACGVLPVQTYHSGFADVVDVYEENFRDVFKAAGIKHLTLDEKLVPGLASNITALLGYLEKITIEERSHLAHRAHRLAEEHFSWTKIAESYLEA